MKTESVTILLVATCHFTVIAGNTWVSDSEDPGQPKLGENSYFDRLQHGMKLTNQRPIDNFGFNDRQPGYGSPGNLNLGRFNDRSRIEQPGQNFVGKQPAQNRFCDLPLVHPFGQPWQSSIGNPYLDRSNDRSKPEQPGQNFIGNPFVDGSNHRTRYDVQQPEQNSVSNPSFGHPFERPEQSSFENPYLDRSNDRSKSEQEAQNSASNPSERLKQSSTRNPYLAKLNHRRRNDNSDDEKETNLHDSKKKPNLNKNKDGKKPLAATRLLSFDSGPDNYGGIEYFVSRGKIYGCNGDISTITNLCMGNYIPATPIKEKELCQQKVTATVDNMICVSNDDVKILTYNGRMFCKKTRDQDTLVIDSAEYSRICSQLFG